MIKLIDLTEEQLDDMFYCGMPLMSSETGLNIPIWVTVKPFYDKTSEPYLIVFEDIKRITSNSRYITITVSDIPELLTENFSISTENIKQIERFIRNNLKVLEDFWNHLIDSSDFFDELKLI